MHECCRDESISFHFLPLILYLLWILCGLALRRVLRFIPFRLPIRTIRNVSSSTRNMSAAMYIKTVGGHDDRSGRVYDTIANKLRKDEARPLTASICVEMEWSRRFTHSPLLNNQLRLLWKDEEKEKVSADVDRSSTKVSRSSHYSLSSLFLSNSHRLLALHSPVAIS